MRRRHRETPHAHMTDVDAAAELWDACADLTGGLHPRRPPTAATEDSLSNVAANPEFAPLPVVACLITVVRRRRAEGPMPNLPQGVYGGSPGSSSCSSRRRPWGPRRPAVIRPADGNSCMGISARRPAQFVADVRGGDRRLNIGEGAMDISGEKRQTGQGIPRLPDTSFHFSRRSADGQESSPNVPRNVLQEAAFCFALAGFADLFAGNSRGYSRTQNAPIVSADRFRVVMTCAL